MSSSSSKLSMAKPYTTPASRACQYCFKLFNAKGHASHEKACRIVTTAAMRDREYQISLETRSPKRSKVFRFVVRFMKSSCSAIR